MREIAAVSVLLAVALLSSGCEREGRTLHVTSAQAQAVRGPRAVVIHAGPGPESTQVASGVRPSRYRETAQAVQLGQQLFSSYNCSGCHSDGGGGMGPSFMDARWYYGHRPEQIFDSIVQGRPNG